MVAHKQDPNIDVWDRPLTTGDVARAFNVAHRTAAKWMDTGMLPAYRVPGSKDRRVLASALMEFAQEHGLPTRRLREFLGLAKVTILGVHEKTAKAIIEHGKIKAHAAYDTFELGRLIGRLHPACVVLDDTVKQVFDAVYMQRPTLCEMVILTSSMQRADVDRWSRREGVHVLMMPAPLGDVLKVIEDAATGSDR